MPKTLTPETLTDLSRLLARHRNRAVIVIEADGTQRPGPNRTVIDVSGIPGFSNITRRGQTCQIGAGATLGGVLREIQGENGLLRQAVSMMANPLVRNRVTVLSALDPESQYFDLATALVSLHARVRVRSQKGGRSVAIDDFLVAAAEGLKSGEFPSAVEFTALDPEYRAGFFRVNPGRGKPTVSASVLARLRRNVAVDPKIAVSSSTVIPVPVPGASRALTRQVLSDNNIKKVAEIAAAEMLEMAGMEEDDPYERSLIEVAVSRAIRRMSETPAGVAPPR